MILVLFFMCDFRHDHVRFFIVLAFEYCQSHAKFTPPGLSHLEIL